MGDSDRTTDRQKPSSLGSRLQAARERGFVGRMNEVELFRSALAADLPPFAVLYLHGPGGVGKTALLHQFKQEARKAGRLPVSVDGRSVETSPASFLAELAAQLDIDADDDVLSAIHELEQPVLLIDTYEQLNPIDGWLRQQFLPKLPGDTLVVIAGRDAPAEGWRAEPGWRDLVHVVPLRNLDRDDARELLAMRGVPEARRDEALTVARGHPLALVLVAEVMAQHPSDGPFSLTDAPDVIQLLLNRFVRHVPSDSHRDALVACAHASFATEPLLRDVIDAAAAPELFRWLRDLSFSQLTSQGVALHDLVAEALDAEARWRDPDGYFHMHRRINRHLGRRVARTSGREQQQALWHQLQLHRLSPVTSPFYDWDARRDVWIEAAEPSDHDAIVDMVKQHEGPESAEIARYWLDRQPEAFRVFHTATGERPEGFVADVLLEGEPRDEVEVDPVAAAAWEHVRRAGPLRAGERVLLLRFWIDRETYQDVATHHLVSTQAAIDWFSTESLAWSFTTLHEASFWEPVFSFIDFQRVDDADVRVGDRSYGFFARDWRVESRQDWFERLAKRQIGLETPRPHPEDDDALEVLSEEEFEDAVRDALRDYARAGDFAGNPLLDCRVVVERARGQSRSEALAELLEEAADALSAHPRDEKLQRALRLTYFKPAPTQEAAAERLDLPYSTFRRHLTDGVEHVVSWLWERELHGSSSSRGAGSLDPGPSSRS